MAKKVFDEIDLSDKDMGESIRSRFSTTAPGSRNPQEKMDVEYKDFIGIYDNSVPISLCDVFVKNWDEAKEKMEVIETHPATGQPRPENYIQKKDETAHITPLSSTIYPVPPCNAYFDYLKKCFNLYIEKYSFSYLGPIFNDQFKIHKVREAQGYHSWHYETFDGTNHDRMIVYMTYLQCPEEGGETEFLHQSMRIKPLVGRTLIWPAYYTHVHRGNTPLKGDKMYITGWFTGGRAVDNRPHA